ncbi:hypothetical protein QOZ83_15950 [Romboutsia sedimentorum]|uniref:hypothetical protein n=1 Tax=Romboutsia sedimentorum TaxID=1368474 RepID=UPI0024DE15C6|nr:hypothetical protein [Romboutsia sedimentorum]MDK2587340.1 hypothetical protein [Romboutsia sedimentorum]
MNFKKKLQSSIKEMKVEVKEEKVQDTIKKSIEVFYYIEQEKVLSYYEFLWAQLKFIKKRWWIFQMLLLCVLGVILLWVYEESYIQRSMGIMASLFIILIIPEFWKNKSYKCMEIEETSYYSLRQIYSARIFMFAIVDVLLLSIFCGTVTIGLNFEIENLIIQFFLPMLITACICFGTLCSNYILNESVAIILCLIWSAVWSIIILDERIYQAITLPVWISVFGLAFAFLCITIYRTLNNCNQYWEVALDGAEDN